jgi:hypothetical protein
MFTTAILTAILASSPVSQNEIHEIITHKNYEKEISTKNEVWKVFTDRKRLFDDGVRIQPVLSQEDAIHRSFCANSLGMTSHQFRTFWLRKRFTEPARLPIQSPSDAVTRKGVQERSNWIGVVAASSTRSRFRNLNRALRLHSGL